jgi:hypothetical protein
MRRHARDAEILEAGITTVGEIEIVRHLDRAAQTVALDPLAIPGDLSA